MPKIHSQAITSGLNSRKICKQAIRQIIRKEMRANRQALSAEQQSQAAQNILSQALDLITQHNFSTFAFYLPFNGEISPLPLIQALQTQGKRCVLPILHPFAENHLQFLAYHSEKDLIPNRFGILEPKLDVRKIVPFDEIEMIFVPLVACDKQNNRLGMGGGFYDRTLAQMPNAMTVGLAHRCQLVEQLPIESWDMPLNHILLG